MEEIWKPIQDFPGYEISSHGRVRSYKQGKRIILKPLNARGYFRVDLCAAGKVIHKQVHRLVLEAFIGECPASMECSHLNGDKKNNNIENLAWETHTKNERRKDNTKLNELKVRQIRLLLEQGWTGVKLAQKFGVDNKQISRIKHNKAWNEIA